MAETSTPDRLRLMAVVTVLVVVAVGLIAWLLTDRLVDETEAVANSTGEVLIATQQISASFAEADAAAAAVHLAGAEGNREQRRLFEQAMDRATSSLEDVARLVGDDDRSHDALQDIASRTIRYTGLVDAARLASVEDLAQADTLLRQASALNRDEISPEVQIIATRARARFDDETSSSWYSVALILLIVAALVVLGAQLMLQRRFRRLINLPLALASVIMLALVFMGGRAFFTQQQAFNDSSDEAYEAILVSQEIQENAYRHRALATESVLAGRSSAISLDALKDSLTRPDDGLLLLARIQTDSPREVATADEIRTRWNRYNLESDKIQAALDQGLNDIAESIAQGPANAAFNGFNTTVEAALLDNREQFLDQLDRASDSLRWLREMILIGTLVAALLAWWGFAQRIGEYR